MKGNYNMQDKIKSTINKVDKNAFFAKAKNGYRKFSEKLCRANCEIGHLFDKTGADLAKAGLSANFVTIVGFIIGLFAINFLSLQMYFTALMLILINRIFDALDGAIARNSKMTDFGVFLDAALDYIFYAGIIFGFALANPMLNAVSASFLLFAFTSSACAMLAYAVIAYKNNAKEKMDLNQSPFYLGGIAQGSETLVAFVIMCLIPGWFMPIAIILGALSIVKALSVIVAAYYNFVISEKNTKRTEKNEPTN